MIKYDNCKTCANTNCEHYEENREFVCPGGISCRVERTDFAADANMFCEAIKALASNESALVNLESYLGQHFGEWMRKYANSPAGLAYELKEFARIDF